MLLRDDSNGIPKYIQLAKILKDQILAGVFRDDEQIPTEQSLCERYQVSRITVRQAINTLAQEKLLYREQGRGTFVQPKKLKRDITKVYNFTDDMIHLGLKPSSRLLEQEVIEAEPSLAEKLQLPADQRRVLKLLRLREANGIPVLCETTLIPYFLCPGLEREDLQTGSLYHLLAERFNLLPHHAEETYEAVIMPENSARLLQCKSVKCQPALSIHRIAFLDNGVPMECTTSIGRADRLTLSVQMVAENSMLKRNIDLK
ncbi:MAG: GntR family transcriptional regulator [Chlorobium sp.]|nr:GntR family transcriptional regulator [Chlorobium sp.]